MKNKEITKLFRKQKKRKEKWEKKKREKKKKIKEKRKKETEKNEEKRGKGKKNKKDQKEQKGKKIEEKGPLFAWAWLKCARPLGPFSFLKCPLFSKNWIFRTP